MTSVERRRAGIHGVTALGAAALLLAGCASPLAPGEDLYRSGDLWGALERWRSQDDSDLAPRIAAVKAELAARADGNIATARAHEKEGRLTEAVLEYRLALELRPDDLETLSHVQNLAREVSEQRAVLLDSYLAVREQGDLAAAQQALAQLRQLDPFEPAFETEQQRLRADIAGAARRRKALIREQQTAQVESLVEAGRAAFGEEQLETALDLWRRALLIDPDNERLQAYIARAERQLETLERLRAEPGVD